MRGNGERQRISLASTEEVDCGIERQLQIFYCEERLDSSQISTTCYFLSELIMLGLGSVSSCPKTAPSNMNVQVQRKLRVQVR